MLKKMLFALVLSLFITSCATTKRTLKTDTDVANTEETNAYLLLGLSVNQSLKEMYLNGPEDIRLTYQDLTSDSDFILVPVKAGEYSFGLIRLDSIFRLNMDDKDKWTFTVSPNTVNYVGHFELARNGVWGSRVYVELVNRSTEAYLFMEDRFPNILNKRAIAYRGPGEDYFYNFISELGE